MRRTSASSQWRSCASQDKLRLSDPASELRGSARGSFNIYNVHPCVEARAENCQRRRDRQDGWGPGAPSAVQAVPLGPPERRWSVSI